MLALSQHLSLRISSMVPPLAKCVLSYFLGKFHLCNDIGRSHSAENLDGTLRVDWKSGTWKFSHALLDVLVITPVAMCYGWVEKDEKGAFYEFESRAKAIEVV